MSFENIITAYQCQSIRNIIKSTKYENKTMLMIKQLQATKNQINKIKIKDRTERMKKHKCVHSQRQRLRRLKEKSGGI